MLLLQRAIVSRPLCPPLIHDDFTRLVVIAVGLVVSLYVLYRVMRYFNGV